MLILLAERRLIPVARLLEMSLEPTFEALEALSSHKPPRPRLLRTLLLLKFETEEFTSSKAPPPSLLLKLVLLTVLAEPPDSSIPTPLESKVFWSTVPTDEPLKMLKPVPP